MSYFKNNFLPAIVWAAFHLLFVHWQTNALGGLLALRGLLVFYFLLVRVAPEKTAPLYQVLMSWFSTWLPTQLLWTSYGTVSGDTGVAFIIVGSLVVGFSIVDLGKSFGISPALRPYVHSGIYKHLSNPMYWGHLIGEIGVLVVTPTPKNVAIVLVGWSLYWIRAKWERDLATGQYTAAMPKLVVDQQGLQKWPESQVEVL